MISIMRHHTCSGLDGYDNGRRGTAPDPGNTLTKSPPKSVRTSGVCEPRHISFAGVTLHLTH